MKVQIYTDGSSKANGTENNGGGCGVAVLIEDSGYQSGYRIDKTWHEHTIETTTNNREELKAILYALELSQTKYINDLCYIKSDSAYCVNMYNDWIDKWHSKGWLKSDNKPVENIDLVKKIYEYTQIPFPNFILEKVSGHSGVFGNELVDALATNDGIKLAKILKANELVSIKE